MEVNIKELPANLAGEIVLHLLNPCDRWGYTTDQLSVGYQEHITKAVPSFVSKHLWTSGEYVAMVTGDGSFTVYLQWDGDGVIVVDFGTNKYLVNTDCKKDYDWRWKTIE